MFKVEWHSSRPIPVGQSSLQSRLGRILAGLLLVALASGVAGCKSIYKQTRGALPPDPAAELRLRLDDARRAENLVTQAAQKLHRDLKHAFTGDVIQVDFDRLETAAFDLERRVLTAHESLARSRESSNLSGQIGLLQRRASAWLGYVQAYRQTDAPTQARQLAPLLDHPTAKQ